MTGYYNVSETIATQILGNSPRHETDGNGRCYNLPRVSLEAILTLNISQLFLSHVTGPDIRHCSIARTITERNKKY